MRILGPVVASSSGVMPTLDPGIARSGAVKPQIVRDQCLLQEATFLHEFAHQFQRRGLIPFGLDQHIQNLTFTIDLSPEIDEASIDLQIDFVEMPCSVRLRPAFEKICRDHGSKKIEPATHGFMGDHDPAFRQQILDVAEAQAESDINANRTLNDHGREAVAGVARFGHVGRYGPKVNAGKRPTLRCPRHM